MSCADWSQERVTEFILGEFGETVANLFEGSLHMHTLGVTVLSMVLLLHTTQWLVNVNMYPLLSLIEQGIDGETLQILAEEGSVGQLRECGLTKIKDQLKLKRLIKHSTCTAATMPPAASNTNHSVAQDRKLEKKEIASLPPEEKKAYLIK